MGTFRNDEDTAYFHSVAQEVVDLFGVDDANLYRFSAANNITTRDPLYDEPSSGDTVKYHAYAVKVMFFNYSDNPFVSESGLYQESTSEGYASVAHLLAGGVPLDSAGEWIADGDVIEIHNRSQGRIIYDIIQSTKAGFINDTGDFTGYTFSLKRSTKYVPERKEINS